MVNVESFKRCVQMTNQTKFDIAWWLALILAFYLIFS